MLFLVEQRKGSRWRVIAAALEAATHRQAVARAAPDAGIFRVLSLSEPEACFRHFEVPHWGPPVAVEADGGST
jgi:hypothetical protein